MKLGTLSMKTLLAPECIAMDVAPASVEQCLDEAARLFHESHGLRRSDVAQRLWRRERRQSTALGYGIALPHADVHSLTRPVAAFMRVRHPLAFQAPDRQTVRDVFVLLVPRPATAGHFELLSHYRRLLTQEGFRQRLAACGDEAAVWRLFEQHEWR
ncbi:MAG TPA: PTS sugar transporter subunit IIA [Ramlibacter sp.]|nr:PTS sugar transporter subunit IIA [Ramlibacter sp.]